MLYCTDEHLERARKLMNLDEIKIGDFVKITIVFGTDDHLTDCWTVVKEINCETGLITVKAGKEVYHIRTSYILEHISQRVT